MPSPTRVFPDDRRLEQALALAMRSTGSSACPVRVIRREPNLYASRSPSEILTCRRHDGHEFELLCKYPTPSTDDDHGHHAGIAREVNVYRNVLAPLGCTAPRFYGAYDDPDDGRPWLFVEYLRKATRLTRTLLPRVTQRAAEWIARFHAANEQRHTDGRRLGIDTYDAEFYAGWARRASSFAGDLHDAYPWLRGLCQCYETFVSALLDPPHTVIHGEYYSGNVLIDADAVHPIDWESAAWAAGEIDLAALTEFWDPETVEACEHIYRAARWGSEAPPDFDRRLAAARMYLQFRWLGDRPAWTHQDDARRRFEVLHALGQTWGLILSDSRTP